MSRIYAKKLEKLSENSVLNTFVSPWRKYAYPILQLYISLAGIQQVFLRNRQIRFEATWNQTYKLA